MASQWVNTEVPEYPTRSQAFKRIYLNEKTKVNNDFHLI